MIKEITQYTKFTWLQVSNLTPSEQDMLVNKYNLTNELIFYATDPNESARMEYDSKTNNILMIFDVVTPEIGRAHV